MVEIIRPKFKRDRQRKNRMVKSKPSLAEHPEFQDEPDIVKPTLLVALVGILFVLLGKRH